VNKKLNTAAFFLVATLVNILMVIGIALALFIPYALLVAPHVASAVNLVALLVAVIGSMVGSFPLYRRLIAWFEKKVDVDKYFDPIVKQSRGRGPSRR
jgi:uncharacterized membrane protein YdjX (TVP38/TMEM64 family)